MNISPAAAIRAEPGCERDRNGTDAAGAGHRLTVREVIVETADARSIVFDVPEASARVFAYVPGQFLTLRIELPDGSAVARCYSLSSTPGLDAAPTVTVKRIPGGVASQWLVDHLTAGIELESLPPSGNFTVRDTTKDLLLFAAGSGITPVMSILRDALHNARTSIVLVYANRDEQSVIFAEELRRLSSRFPARLTVVHLLESIQGLPTPALLGRMARIADLESSVAYVCGPPPFMAAVEEVLHEAGMPHDQVVVERFVSLNTDPFRPKPHKTLTGGDVFPLQVVLDGEQHQLIWPSATTLLDFLLSKGIPAPFSCREGACSACSCRLLAGAVAMAENRILDQQDIDEGWVLGCQARPTGTDPISVTYD